MRCFLMTAFLAGVIVTVVAFNVEGEPGRQAQTLARDFPRAAAQTATWTHTFQKTCDTDYCREQVVFPLMISKKKEAPPGSVKMTYTILPSQPRDEALHFALWKKGYKPGEPMDGNDLVFRYHLDLTGANSPRGADINLGPLKLWGDFTFEVEGFSGRKSVISVEVTLTYPLLEKQKPRKLFFVSNHTTPHTISEAVAHDLIAYSGSDWAAKGGPISVFSGKRRIARFSARTSFSGKFQLPAWKKNDCSEIISAQQGKTTRKVKISGRRFWKAKAASSNVKISGRVIKKGDYICEGERPIEGVSEIGTALVVQALEKRELSSFDGLGVFSRPSSGLEATEVGGVFASKVQVWYKKGKSITAVDGPTVNLTRWDPAAVEGPKYRIKHISTFDQNYLLSGYYRVDQPQGTALGNLRIHGALIYAVGRLDVNGAVIGPDTGLGVGAIVALGNLVIGSGVKMINDVYNQPVSSVPLAVTMASGGKIVVNNRLAGK